MKGFKCDKFEIRILLFKMLHVDEDALTFINAREIVIMNRDIILPNTCYLYIHSFFVPELPISEIPLSMSPNT